MKRRAKQDSWHLQAAEAECAQVQHDLKVHSEPYAALASGLKKYEIRSTVDRDFRVHDKLRLWEVDSNLQRTGQWLLFRVTYITSGGDYGLPDNLCVMSIIPIDGGVEIVRSFDGNDAAAGSPVREERFVCERQFCTHAFHCPMCRKAWDASEVGDAKDFECECGRKFTVEVSLKYTITALAE